MTLKSYRFQSLQSSRSVCFAAPWWLCLPSHLPSPQPYPKYFPPVWAPIFAMTCLPCWSFWYRGKCWSFDPSNVLQGTVPQPISSLLGRLLATLPEVDLWVESHQPASQWDQESLSCEDVNEFPADWGSYESAWGTWPYELKDCDDPVADRCLGLPPSPGLDQVHVGMACGRGGDRSMGWFWHVMTHDQKSGILKEIEPWTELLWLGSRISFILLLYYRYYQYWAIYESKWSMLRPMLMTRAMGVECSQAAEALHLQ